MSQQKISSTYWTFTIIIVIFMTVLGYVAGYSYRNYLAQQHAVEVNTTSPDIADAILEQQVVESLSGNIGGDNSAEDSNGETIVIAAPTELYTFTGYVFAIDGTSVLVDHPSDATNIEDVLSFQLQGNTVYTTLTSTTDATGFSRTIENESTLDTIAVGDIVTVYTLENILESETRTAQKIQKIDQSTNLDSLTQ